MVVDLPMNASDSVIEGPVLRERAKSARELLRCCTMCEHRCGIDRASGAHSPCGLGAETWSYKRHVSFSEELELLPSYMVYLSGCNFRCRFCVQGPTCFSPTAGQRVEPRELAGELQRIISRGAKTINLLGGEPSLHLHTILELAAESPEPLPLVLNSNMYMTVEVLRLLEGVVSIYLGDFKFGNDACAQRIAGVERYVEVVTRNLTIASEQAHVMIRHLLMPGHFECCLVPVAEWVAANLPQATFSLMTSYVPAWRAAEDAHGLDRCTTEDEGEQARRFVAQLGLKRSD